MNTVTDIQYREGMFGTMGRHLEDIRGCSVQLGGIISTVRIILARIVDVTLVL